MHLVPVCFSERPHRATAAGEPRRRSGIAAAEFAFIAPLLGLLIIGMFELSRGMQVKDILCDAARKGCRTGIRPGKGNSDITTDATNILTDNNIPTTNAKVNITVTDTSGNSVSDALSAGEGSKVTVQVTIPASDTLWVSAFFLKSSVIQSKSLTMAKQ